MADHGRGGYTDHSFSISLGLVDQDHPQVLQEHFPYFAAQLCSCRLNIYWLYNHCHQRIDDLKSFLPFFGINIVEGRGWKSIHDLASNLTLLLVAFHFALHWDWVWKTFKQILTGLFRPRSLQTVAESTNPDEELEGE